jgi:two-component system response regulator FixJ
MNSTAEATTDEISTDTPTVFIVDDESSMRDSLTTLIESAGLRTQSFSTANDFLDNLQEDQPSCLVSDLRMPEMNGIELQRQLLDRQCLIPIIFITGYDEVPVVVEAMKAGAVDVIRKPCYPQALLERIRAALKHNQEQRKLRARRDLVTQRAAQLSPREHEVMELLVSAKSTRQVAAELEISPKTVDNHRARIFSKMRVDNIPSLMLSILDSRRS